MGKGRRNREKRKAQESGGTPTQADRDHTPLDRHHRDGKRLVPPLMHPDLPIHLASWFNERMPEMLWAVLIVGAFERTKALSGLRSACVVIDKWDGISGDLTLTGIAALPSDVRTDMLSALCHHEQGRKALRPILLFDDLPARDEWRAAIGEDPSAPGDWQALAHAVFDVADHQSQAATDVRWARVMGLLIGGTFHPGAELMEQFLGYPNVGDQRSVRPSIRASEGAISTMAGTALNVDGLEGNSVGRTGNPWPARFWDTCLERTVCHAVALPHTSALTAATTSQAAVAKALTVVAAHAKETRTTTSVDARHEGAFGLVQYALMLLNELLGLDVSVGILGRDGLRSLLECTLTLAYLVQKDDPLTWLTYRQYGAGQAKLAFLKLDEGAEALPAFVDVKVLEALASEDQWHEFVTIDLGHWKGSNLRALSEDAGKKELYDQYYPWTSAFVHASWGAVRLAAYDLCANPLHRWHRVLRPSRATLDDVVADACLMVDIALATLDKLYPGVTARVTLPRAS